MNFENYKSKNYLKALYNSSLLMLTKSFVNNEITIDEYKSALQLLCENYRKEFKIKYYGKSQTFE